MSVGVQEVKSTIEKLSKAIIANEVYFCELDSAAGDGDFGMSIAKGFKVVLKEIDEIDDSSASAFIRGAGMIIMEHCGGASGPIWGSAFMAAARSIKGKDVLEVDDIADMFVDATLGIQKRGGAQLGDKTLLDALIPAAQALKKAAEEGKDMKAAFADATKAAQDGAEHTKTIVARKGRASYLGERSLDHPDAGAMAMGVLFKELTQ